MEYRHLCGLDEAGRGALAGPIFASAVIVRCSAQEIVSQAPVPVRDSKTLSPLQRNKLHHFILGMPITVAVSYLPATLINQMGIGWANKTVFERLIESLDSSQYLVDGNLQLNTSRGSRVVSQVKADAAVLPVTLAGIIAKVERDNYMELLNRDFPQYGWSQNRGYGTQAHIQALRDHGPCSHHRDTFVETALKRKKGK